MSDGMLRGLSLTLWFALEIAAFVAIGYWGFTTPDNLLLRIVAGVGLPVLAAGLWGVFRVPGDGGPPLVTVPPQVRLVLEIVVFSLAASLLYRAGQPVLALGLIGLVLLNYAMDHQRTLWFLSGRGPAGKER